MTDYRDAGVDIEQGDKASASAYAHAASTFASRKGMIGEPVLEKDGFAGFLDMGDYYLVQSDDSTGTKIDLAFTIGKLDTLGYDLVAMVADDAVCTGAEPISISNTLDVPKIDQNVIDQLMGGLAKACSEQKIVIPAGEIAEVPGAVEKGVWSATVVGIVEKDKVLKPETIEAGDVIIALKSAGPRCNGYSLIRKILEGNLNEEWKDGQTWGEVMLTPSIIYSSKLLELLGRFGEERKVNVKGLAHITGGGIPSKLGRTLKKSGLGAELTDLWAPHEALVDVIKLGEVPTDEAYRTWNMGNGMMVVVGKDEAQKALKMLNGDKIEAKRAGMVCKSHTITINAFDGTEVTF
ncbi:MAG: phosphoribosylformylglycinamidine cyclo-ligase [Patescibacteria group bacterium]